MKNLLMAVIVSFLAIGLGAGNAEAARLGGGKSAGMQRQSITPKPAAPMQAAPSPSSPSAAGAAAPARNWLGPLAGLAAGVGLAALFSKLGLGAGMANFLMMALLAVAAIVVFKWLFRRQASAGQATAPLQYAGFEGVTAAPPSTAGSQSAPSPAVISSAQGLPADFDTQAFIRVAKLNFIRLQAANDTRNLEDIREFVSPELFAEIKMQMDERGKAPQQTDVVTLNADVIDVTTESNRHLASVQFSGMIRETAGAAATPFNEVWNLSKPTAGNGGWVVAGIQQLV